MGVTDFVLGKGVWKKAGPKKLAHVTLHDHRGVSNTPELSRIDYGGERPDSLEVIMSHET